MTIREVENILQKKKSPESAIFLSETMRDGKLYSFPSWIVGEGVDRGAFRRRHSFLPFQTRIRSRHKKVSMPSNGPHSFLPPGIIEFWVIMK